MSETRISIPVDQIHVPEKYVRPLDEAAALVLARQMEAEGQKTPIAVYKSTARHGGTIPFTLVYGRRRLWAAKYLGWSEIETVLRLKADAPMLAVADNLEMPSLEALEQAEHLTEYRKQWEDVHGTFGRGGDRKSKRQDVVLINPFGLSNKELFYNDLALKFNISERMAQRLFKIGGLHENLRNALRGTAYANDKTKLKMLATAFEDEEQQRDIAARLAANPDLEAVLREGNRETGREPVGRQETPQWQEEHLMKHLDRMPAELRDAVLERLGYVRKPLDPMPSHLPPVVTVPAPGNVSPLRPMLHDPYRHLSRRFTYEEVQRLKVRYEQEEREAELYERTIEASIQAIEEERRSAFAEEKEKAEAKAVRARRKRTGLSVVLPRREAKMMAELDLALQRKLSDVRRDRSAELVRACHKLDEVRQAEMIHMLFKDCDYALAIECAQALHYDQLSKARGTARLEIEQPKLPVKEGRFKRLLPQLVSRLFALQLDRFYSGRSVFGTLPPEQQLEICAMFDVGIAFEEIELHARRMSPNDEVRRRLDVEMIEQRFALDHDDMPPKPFH